MADTSALPSAPTARTSRAVPVPRRKGDAAALGFAYVWWVLVVFEPDWFLTGTIGGPFYRIPLLLLPFLILVLLRFADRRAIHLPFLLFLLLHVIALPYAENRGYVLWSIKVLFYTFATCVAVAALANTPARVVTLLRIYLLGFVWYGVQGLATGQVEWHTLMANEDSYGPFMVMALGFSYGLATGTRSRKWRLLGLATAALGCIGVVSSFARGAVLSFVAVLGAIWLRSRHKLRTLGAGLVAAAVTLVAINVLFPQGEFWEEMQTISEGTEGGTGQTRWISWLLAVQVFAHHPILGVGPENFGPAASQMVAFDAGRPAWADPAQIYNLALHNVYVQILCEEGLVGILLFGWMTVDHFRRLQRLRRPRAVALWRYHGGQLDLRSVSLALETAMIGYLASAIFYNQIYVHWFWTLITLSFVTARVVETLPVPGAPPRNGPPAARGRPDPQAGPGPRR